MAPTFHHSLGVGVDKLHVLGMYPYPLQPLALRGTMEELKKKKKDSSYTRLLPRGFIVMQSKVVGCWSH